MIFQNPLSALDPVYTIGDQIVEIIRIHEKISKKEAYEKAVFLLKQVKIPSPEVRIQQYPHELSGEMCIRDRYFALILFSGIRYRYCLHKGLGLSLIHIYTKGCLFHFLYPMCFPHED